MDCFVDAVQQSGEYVEDNYEEIPKHSFKKRTQRQSGSLTGRWRIFAPSQRNQILFVTGPTQKQNMRD